MSFVDPTIIAALRNAVQADAENIPLRLYLAGLLIGADRQEEALREASTVLARQPDNLEALRIAAKAADGLGDTTRAEGYRRLLRALGGSETETAESAPTSDPPARDYTREEEVDEPEAIPLRLTDSFFGISGDPERASAEELIESEEPRVTLASVAGMEAVKRRLNVAFLGPMKNPSMRALYGKSLRGGLLLYGPPGCGKTFIARATAGELGARFLSVGLSDVLDMYIGQSERNLHEIFEMARRQRPCVLFFDEIDALGRKRSLMRESAGRNIANQLLAEMDSVGTDNEGIFILAATNHPWDVDTALRRPGRLDRTLLVLPPDTPAREAILRSVSEGRPLESGLDFGWLAARTEDYSGADVSHLVEAAAEIAMEASILSGKVRPITMNDFKQAMKEVRPSVRPWFETARNYALFANEGGVYDDLVEYLRARKLA